MELVENLLHMFNTDVVNLIILSLMFGIFILGIFFAKNEKQSEFVQYIPTLLTTIGIFGTFFGIVLGLLEFNQSDIEASVPPLLDGLKSAFITSLAGIFSSLIFKTLSTFSFLKPKTNQENIEHASPEAILKAIQSQLEQTKILKEALVGNEESTLFGQLKILRADMNDNAKLSIKYQTDQLNNQHTQALQQQENFEAFSQQLWITLRDVSNSLSKSATEQVIEALKQVISDFNHNLTEQFGSNFMLLNEAVHKLVDWQENYKWQLEEMSEQYAQGVEAIFKTQIAVAHISEQSKTIPESMHDLKSVLEVNQHQLSGLERHLEAFSMMRDEAVKAVPEIRSQVQNTVNDISEAVSTATDHYKQLLSDSDQYIKTHTETSNEFLHQFTTETQKSIKSVEEMAATLSTETQKSIKSVVEMATTLSSETKDVSNTIKQANQNLLTDTQQIREMVITLSEELQERLNDVIHDVANQQINQAKRTFDAMEEQVKQQVGLTAEAVDAQLKLIDSAMQLEINRVMNEMGQALAQVSGKFVEDYVILTSAMNDIINQRVA